MPLLFHQVPEWTSWENQGANVAIADLDQDGLPELIVLPVDHLTPGPPHNGKQYSTRDLEPAICNTFKLAYG
jgi:hypothetical protein